MPSTPPLDRRSGNTILQKETAGLKDALATFTGDIARATRQLLEHIWLVARQVSARDMRRIRMRILRWSTFVGLLAILVPVLAKLLVGTLVALVVGCQVVLILLVIRARKRSK